MMRKVLFLGMMLYSVITAVLTTTNKLRLEIWMIYNFSTPHTLKLA